MNINFPVKAVPSHEIEQSYADYGLTAAVVSAEKLTYHKCGHALSFLPMVRHFERIDSRRNYNELILAANLPVTFDIIHRGFVYVVDHRWWCAGAGAAKWYAETKAGAKALRKEKETA